jgi:1-acyl-sn-glycerol-3-phosphate acyltransferase
MIRIGEQVPRRGNAFSRWLGRFVLRLIGWRIEGAVPDVPKMVLIGAPHTSNMDGVLAMIVLTALGLRAGTMIKDTAFHGVLGVVLRWFGALPINRRSPKGVVEQSVEAFNSSDRLVLLIAPEGTRTSTEEWKRGFHHIARGAGVPIALATVNYRDRIVTFGPAVTPSADYAVDLARIVDWYRSHAWGRHPERMSKPICNVLGVPWKS